MIPQIHAEIEIATGSLVHASHVCRKTLTSDFLIYFVDIPFLGSILGSIIQTMEGQYAIECCSFKPFLGPVH
jgi:hypothetical protein